MSDIFDPNLFLEAVTEQASIRRDPLPAGDYTALITEVEAKRWTTDKPDAKASSGVRLEIKLLLSIPPEIVERLGYDSAELTVKDSLMLDVTADGRGLDYSKGKNNQLRTYRDALGMNEAGSAFAPSMMKGRAILVRIKHELYNGAVMERPAGVARAG